VVVPVAGVVELEGVGAGAMRLTNRSCRCSC
jgi:hypothetical protein